MKNVLIFGATSAIAEATAREYALKGCNLFLVARNTEKLETIATDLKVRGATDTAYAQLDINELQQHQSILELANSKWGDIDLVLIAHGTLPDQQACEASVEQSLDEIKTNALSTISLLTLLGNQFEQRKSGAIAVITSVAGDRGRQSNYVYGSAKAMVSTFLSGLRNRLAKSNVQVLDIKPGFVDTPMTAEFDKGPLWAQPQDIAKAIVKSVEKNRNIAYAPFFWWGIMMIIRNIPEFIFKKLKL